MELCESDYSGWLACFRVGCLGFKVALVPLCWDGYRDGWDEMASLKLDFRSSQSDKEIDEMSVSKQGTNNDLAINL